MDARGRLFVSAGNALLSLDSFTGSPRWQFNITTPGTNLQSSPSIGGDGVVFVGTHTGGVAAIWDGSVRLQTDPACVQACNNDVQVSWSQIGADPGHRGAANYIAPRATTSITQRWKTYNGTVGYLSFGPIEKILCFCDLSVREKDWRAASQAFERMHSTLSH
jgi:hypothetical protein